MTTKHLASGESKPGLDVDHYRRGTTHAGIDLHAPTNTKVQSPITGTVVYYQTKNGSGQVDPSNTMVVIREDATGKDYVLGHISCTFCDDRGVRANSTDAVKMGAHIRAGDPIGFVLPTDPNFPKYEPHLHMSRNRGQVVGVDGALDPEAVSGRWGSASARNSGQNTDAAQRKFIQDGGWESIDLSEFSEGRN